MTPNTVIAHSEPTTAMLTSVRKHFGWDWQEFLLQREPVAISPEELIEGMALAYQRLDQAELTDLFYSLINNAPPIPGAISRKTYIYDHLHAAVYELIRTGRFNISAVKITLKNLIAGFRDDRRTQVADPTIIDVAPGDLKINYVTETVEAIRRPEPTYLNYDPDDYKLGKLYKDKLGLSAQEETWLNKFLFYSNTFNATDGCKFALIRLYLQVIKRMVRRFANESVTLEQHLDAIQNGAYEASKKENKQWYGYDHNEARRAAETDLYYNVFKKCEAALRISWRAGRSTAPVFHSRSDKALSIYQKSIEPVLDEVVTAQVTLIPAPDADTEMALNAQSTTRWKVTFEDIIGKPNAREEVYELIRLNGANPAIEQIYYEAAKCFAIPDKTEALRFYLRYVDADLRSVRIDNKDFQKTTLKQLFKDADQEQEFRAIVAGLVQTKDLKQALSKVETFYQPKRRQIQLDQAAIRQAAVQLNDTIEVLNIYLADEEEIAVLTPAAAEKMFAGTVNLSPVQQQLLELFEESELALPAAAVAAFAQSQGLFKNQLIESINESCYDAIDDVLIEEADDTYQISAYYFQQLFHVSQS